MRYHSISPSKQFVMNFKMTMPFVPPPTNTAVFYPTPTSNSQGFHMRLNMDIDFMTSFNDINILHFDVAKNLLFSFYNLMLLK